MSIETYSTLYTYTEDLSHSLDPHEAQPDLLHRYSNNEAILYSFILYK